MADFDPFKLVETSAGSFSLLLSTFAPADGVFARHGLEGGGYSWEGVARHVIEKAELDGRVKLDPEGSMFCAYGADREALEALAVELAALFHDLDRLDRVIGEIGPDGFDD